VTAGVFKTRQAVGWQYETRLKIHDAPESSGELLIRSEAQLASLSNIFGSILQKSLCSATQIKDF
jgi:hypothetical protein